MPIYRGEGGSGESSTNALANEVAQDAADAANSASQAATSATSAANSATAAANSATAAAASETAAETAETNAETAETNAAASAAAAATSETNAATSETNAATSETNAATSASNASTSETNASASASQAATSATNAATSETNAATSATNAATSEANAATSASQAATSATSAATSASDAATTYDNFDDRYLGEKTSDPSVDNDGDALITGALYFNSTAGEMRVWDGSAWEAAYLPGSAYLELAGGTMTGTLTLNADPSNSLEAATKQYVDGIAAAGIHYHDPVRVESDVNLNATYNNGSSGVGATLTNAGTQAALVIDGVTVSLNDRVLVYAQTNAFENGVYTVTDTGSASTNWVLTRATDADSYSPSDPNQFGEGDSFFVQEGSTGAGELYVMTTSGAITFGTTDIHFSQISSAQIYNAGTGIGISGNVISNTGLLTTGSTATDLAITSADINGGNIDGTIIGATTPAAGTFATFTSNGIDDNANQSAFLLDSAGYATIVQSVQNTGEGLTLQNLNTNLSVGTAINFELPAVGVGTEASIDYKNTGSAGDFQLNLGVGSTTARVSDMTLNTSGEIVFSTFSTERARITPTGRLGIGTNSPSTTLQVNGTSRVSDGTTNIDTVCSFNIGYFGTQTNHNLALRTNDVERMRITTAGYVGIGTTQPQALLDLYGATSPPTYTGNIRVNGGSTTSKGGIEFVNATSSSGYGWRVDGPDEGSGSTPLVFRSRANSTAWTERMRLNPTGKLEVGGDIQRAGTNTRLHSNGLVLEGGSPTITYRDTGDNVAFHHCNSNLLYVLRGATNTENWTAVNGQWPAYHNLTNNDMQVGGSFAAVGNITAYSSDERLKENITPIPDALSKVMQIKGCTFDWKDIVDDLGFTPTTRKDDVGLIAQDVEAVLPTLVVHAPFDRLTPDPDSEEDQSQSHLESKSGEFYKTIQYEKVCALLVEAIKEQQQQIEELKEKISGATN